MNINKYDIKDIVFQKSNLRYNNIIILKNRRLIFRYLIQS